LPNPGLNLSDYWLVLRKRGWIAVVTFAVILTSTIIHTNKIEPVYLASSSVRIIDRRSVSSLLMELVSPTADSMASQAKVITSQPVMERVIFELGLVSRNASREDITNVIMQVESSITTSPVENTNIIRISVTHRDPKMAAGIANKVAEVYIDYYAKETSEQARKVRIFLEDQVADVAKRLNEAEEKLKDFKKTGEVTGVAVNLVSNLASLEQQRLSLTKIFTEKYPDVVKINEEINRLKEQLKTYPDKELEFARLTRETEVDENAYRGLQVKLQDARIGEAEKIEDVKIVDVAVPPTVPVKPNKQVNITIGGLVGLIMGFFLTFVFESLDTSLGTIEDVEALVKLPVLAVIPYLKGKEVKEKKWGFVRKKPDPVENMRSQLLIKFDRRSPTTEAYRILRTSLKVDELLKNNEKIIVITSTGPNEGKSLTALNLAIVLAENNNKTLLIDADLRKSVLHKVLGLKKEPGLSDVLIGSVKLEDSIRTIVDIFMGDIGADEIAKSPGLDNLNVLTSGTFVPNTSEILDTQRLSQLLQTLKNTYDFIIIDVPPVLPVPDGVIVGSKADRSYLVYRAGMTSRMALLRAKNQMELRNAAPKGVILNCMTPEAELVPNYYYYYNYKYYEEERGKNRKTEKPR